MPPSSAPPSANGGGVLRSRSPPPSGPRQLPPDTPAKTPRSPRAQPSKSTGNFAKVTIVVFVIAVADVVFVWHAIHARLGGEGNPHYHAGAEAGLHRLHETKRRKQLHAHARKVNVAKSGNAFGAHDDVPANNKATQRHHHVMKSDNEAVADAPHQSIDERIAKILTSAGVEADEDFIADYAEQLPTWDDVVALYGEKPIIYGLETCEPYRESVPPEDRMVGPAGIFNTGTNLLFQLVKENCDIKEAQHSTTHKEPKRNGVRWQAPWGKHNPPSNHRGKNVAKMWGADIIQENFFPVVTIKDPYGWMGSMCRHHYSAFWDHGDNGQNCPNLVSKKVAGDAPTEVVTRFAKGWVTYESLIDMWNKWYLEYEEQQFPLLRVRFEDLLFHGKEVTKTICECVGGVSKKRFKYIEESAKENGMPIHKGANGLVKALLQYGSAEKRLAGFTDRDRIYASRALSAELMQRFGYAAPPLPT
ncbi:hypothetical protein ACHAXT_002191 [Thalassiosira profunda]